VTTVSLALGEFVENCGADDASLGHHLQRVVEHLIGFEAQEFRHAEQLVDDFEEVVDVALGVVSMSRHDVVSFRFGFVDTQGIKARRKSRKLTAGERENTDSWSGLPVELPARVATVGVKIEKPEVEGMDVENE
jgi:hypothetical protein